MKQALRRITYKIPLTCKVVSLYVLAFLPIHFFVLSVDAQTNEVDTNQYISELVQVAAERNTEPETITGIPSRLIIPRLGIDLPIEEGLYNRTNDSWTLSSTTVHYATMTSSLNTKAGNTLIYGHNNRDLLAPTRDIRPGDMLEVKTEDGKTFAYRYTADVKVDPSNTQILSANPDTPQLTLLTCDGLWNEKRRLMNFEFVEVGWVQ